MKILITSIFLLLSSFMVQGQEWQTDFDKAKEIASKNKQNIILVFSGSDWCAPCIKLEKEIWSSVEFIDYAKDNFVLLKADFPRKRKNKLSKEQKKRNNELAEKFNQQGYFPLVAVLDQQGNLLGTTGYEKVSPKEYIKILSSF